MERVAAVIGDIVGSRLLDDRPAAQRAVLAAYRRCERHVVPREAGYGSSSDEFQSTYETLDDAVAATTLLSLMLPEGIALRFGIGVGDDYEVEPDQGSRVRDGSAWWRAREALEAVEQLERSGLRHARTRCRTDGEAEASMNGLLLLRDHVIDRLRPRERESIVLMLDDVSQREVAHREGITQSAVSQRLQRTGASSLLAMLRALGVEPA